MNKFLFGSIFIIFSFNLYSQEHVINRAGHYTSNLDFEIISNFGETISKETDKIKSGFLNISRFEKVYKEDYFTTFPNPFIDGFFIELGSDSDLVVYSSIGRLVYSSKIKSGLGYIDMKQFSNGIYFIHLSVPDKQNVGFKLLKIS